ncbi:hypothetical protein LSH36_649g01002 [Paralvinella palmiformis]|uniref:Uncharacterized protein n=1 Tax=Paralvinella palmiformis TaxID=53620 RepID=A0AAD9J3U4_9ANNE|nr:hypothetical protein LSH36_649g01002 [Paralvinella palmiformis]
MLVYQMELFPVTYYNIGSREVALHFSDGSEQLFSDLMCGEDEDTRDVLYVTPVFTTFIKMTITKVFKKEDGYYGLAEIKAYGLNVMLNL